MLVDDILHYPRLAVERSLTALGKSVVVESLSPCVVFLPPSAQRQSVVRTRGGNSQERIARRTSKFHRRLLGHTLDFEAEDIELAHHVGYAGGNHTEVFAAYEHRGRVGESGEFYLRLILPQIVVAVVEIIVVQVADDLFCVLVEILVRIGLEERVARMVGVGIFLVFEKQYFRRQVNQAVFDFLHTEHLFRRREAEALEILFDFCL